AVDLARMRRVAVAGGSVRVVMMIATADRIDGRIQPAVVVRVVGAMLDTVRIAVVRVTAHAAQFFLLGGRQRGVTGIRCLAPGAAEGEALVHLHHVPGGEDDDGEGEERGPRVVVPRAKRDEEL